MTASAGVRVTGLFDLETEAWDTFACGGLYTVEDRRFRHSWDEEEFFDWLLDIEGELWAWNGGLYDFQWFLEKCRQRELSPICSKAGTRVTRIVLGKLVLRDAVALVPMSLAKASTIVGPEISKDTGLLCNCVIPGIDATRKGEQCGGYCRIRAGGVGMRDEERAALVRYLEIDCITGADCVQAIVDFAKERDYQLTGTVGGSAWKTAKHRLGPKLPDADWPSPQHYYLARKGYFGGRVIVARRTAPSGFRQDINSAYPDALSSVPLPWGQMAVASMEQAPRAYKRGLEGIYRARVRVPLDCWLPPLPWRSRCGRVNYPVGDIWGHWTRIELAYAESLGCEVTILAAIVWLETAMPFRPIMNELFETRRGVGKSSGLGTWLKFLQNSYTGKLAQDPEGERVLLCPEPDKVRACPANEKCGGPQDGWRCAGRCRRWECLDESGVGAVWSAKYWRLPDCGLVHVAAYLTSATRIKWHKAALSVGDDLVYGDTDSIYSMRALAAELCGGDLGSFAMEGGFRRFAAVGPKAYRYEDDDGEVECRCKGLQDLSPEDWERYARGEQVVRERGVMGLSSAARAGGSLFRRKKIVRSSNADGVWFGDRRTRGKEDPRTYPCTIRELQRAGRIDA